MILLALSDNLDHAKLTATLAVIFFFAAVIVTALVKPNPIWPLWLLLFVGLGFVAGALYFLT